MRVILISSFLFNVKVMGQDKIPRSVIKGKGFYNVELGDDLESKGGKPLLINADCGLIGLGDTPYALFATPRFNINKLPSEGYNRLPANIGETLYEVQDLYLQASFENYEFSEKAVPDEYPEIPDWVSDFKKVKSLSFDHINIDSLANFKRLPIEKLTLRDIKFHNEADVISALKEFKQLEVVVCDQSVPLSLKHLIKQSNIETRDWSDIE